MKQVNTNKEKVLVKNDEFLVNNVPTNKATLVTTISSWIRNTFVFRNGEVFLPEEKHLPVAGVDEEISKLEGFKKSGMTMALDYLISVVLSIGIKIGKEKVMNEIDIPDSVNKLTKTEKIDIEARCHDNILNDETLSDDEILLYMRGVKDALYPDRFKRL